MRKRVSLIIVVVCILSVTLFGCEEKYKTAFNDRPEAAEMMKEAIDSLQLCLDGKISVGQIGYELEEIADKYETATENDAIADMYRLSISINAHLLSFYAADWELGTESTSSMLNRVKEAKADLEDSLYK